MKNTLFRLGSYVAHYLTSGNTAGYGIHSPYLFYIARAIFPEDAPYYCFRDVERIRRKMILSDEVLDVEDFGTGTSGPRRVSEIATVSLKKREEAQLLFRLVNFIGAETIVELGTCLGITTAYLALPHSSARVHTFEGSSEIARIAKDNWNRLSVRNITLHQGNIDDTLPSVLADLQQVDFAFLDANHTSAATLRYFSLLAAKAQPKSVFVLDDIRYSCDMYTAWKQICRRPEVTATMDLGDMGLVFFDPHYLRQTYKIRF